LALDLPRNANERYDVLEKVCIKLRAKGASLIPDEKSLRTLARAATSLTPDYLRGILVRSGELARRDNSHSVTEQHLFSALLEQVAGPVSNTLASEQRRELVAAHEHGHGLVAHLLGVPPLAISMRARGNSLGMVVNDQERLLESPPVREDLLKYILIVAAGRAGEIAFGGLGSASIGVTKDFEQLTTASRQFFSSGLDDGRFSIAYIQTSEHDLPPKLIADIERLGHRAVDIAQELISAIGSKEFKELVTATSKEQFEVVGSKAESFYQSVVTESAMTKVRKILQDFLTNPLGSSLDSTDRP
jgi:hypothetical protein